MRFVFKCLHLDIEKGKKKNENKIEKKREENNLPTITYNPLIVHLTFQISTELRISVHAKFCRKWAN
jgi:hypothetical protein